MSPHAWLSLFAGAGNLALAFLVLLHPTRSPLARPLALLCLDLVAWNFAALGFDLTGKRAFHLVDLALSPLTAAFGLQLVVVFVGKSRQLRWLLALTFVAFAVVGALPILKISFRPALVCVLLPCTVATFGLLIAHLRGSLDPAERSRTWLLILAFGIGVGLGPLEYFEVRVPIGSLAMLVTTTLVALEAVRFRLLGEELPSAVIGWAVLLATAAVLGCVAMFRALGVGWGVVAGGTAVLSVTMLLAAREVLRHYGTRKARMKELATLGRFSSQMAHDLKNPLAALKGTLQYLGAERDKAKPLADYAEFLDIMLEQVDRLHRVIDDYQRMGRVEPVRRAVDVNELVRRVLGLQPFVSEKVEVRTTLAPDLPSCQADPDLLSAALENVVRNAMEAMPRGGAVSVKTERSSSPDGVVISIEDTGEGMDARAKASAFDEFFTTKATGTGLGLAFVRRVVEAHGGALSLESHVGRGTVVRMELAAGRT